jgi:hypothetical protein
MAKLRGTYNPSAASQPGVATDFQKSIFDAPPGAAITTTAPGANGTAGPQGTKRPREEEEASEGEAPMEEVDESDVPMEASSDED